MSRDVAIRHINREGMLLVFPIDNQKQPLSLWFCLHPRSPMRWEWDADGDDRVAKLWHLREELSRSRRVVYSKWYKGRATLIAQELFAAIVCVTRIDRDARFGLSAIACQILDALEAESPLSTKQLKKHCALKGRQNETVYQRALKELWSRGLIVTFGEFDDGAFPSLGIGATSVLFEDLWQNAARLSEEQAWKLLRERLKLDSPFLKELERQVKSQKRPSATKPAPAIPSEISSEALERGFTKR
jgi:hypothetical protein